MARRWTNNTMASSSGFSERGRVSSDDRTNTLLVVDVPDKVKSIRELVAYKPVQQVLIESRVVGHRQFRARDRRQAGISAAHSVGNTTVTTSGTIAGSQYMVDQALALGGSPTATPIRSFRLDSTVGA